MSALDFNANAYIAVHLTPNSIYLNDAPLQNAITTSFHEIPVAFVGNVGQLPDVKLLGIPKSDWEVSGPSILEALRSDTSNIARVDIQELKSRRKRGDEL